MVRQQIIVILQFTENLLSGNKPFIFFIIQII